MRASSLQTRYFRIATGWTAALNGLVDYTVQMAPAAPPLAAQWDDPAWAAAETLQIRHFRPEGSDHRPHTAARLLYDATGLYGMFRVQDRYVRCLRTEYNDTVWRDSCVEFFAQPKPERGYFNFEFNCGGTFLCSHITNHERTEDGFKEWVKVPPGIGQTIKVHSSLPRRIEQEISEPVLWTLSFFIPFALFEHYLGPLTSVAADVSRRNSSNPKRAPTDVGGYLAGQIWRGNFYKCADESSHPHWASWSPVDEFNFHRPNCFGTIRFA